MSIKELLNKISSGVMSKEDITQLYVKTRKALAGKTDEEDGDKAPQDALSELLGLWEIVKDSPEGRARTKDIMGERKEERFAKKYAPFLKAVISGADVISSFNQISKSNEALRNLRRPEMPGIPGTDPALDQAIRDAQVGTMDAARRVAPARQVLDDQYAKDLAMARAIGGGQAGTMGALSQTAALRRNRGAAELAPMIDQIRAREQGRLDNLIGQRQQQANINYMNRARRAELDLNQYNRDLQAAGQLGSVGRLNLRNSAQSLLNTIPRVAARLSGGYQDGFDKYEQELNNSLIRRRQEIAGKMDQYRPSIPTYQPNIEPILSDTLGNRLRTAVPFVNPKFDDSIPLSLY